MYTVKSKDLIIREILGGEFSYTKIPLRWSGGMLESVSIVIQGNKPLTKEQCQRLREGFNFLVDWWEQIATTQPIVVLPEPITEEERVG